jgi:hypothetical protein
MKRYLIRFDEGIEKILFEVSKNKYDKLLSLFRESCRLHPDGMVERNISEMEMEKEMESEIRRDEHDR